MVVIAIIGDKDRPKNVIGFLSGLKISFICRLISMHMAIANHIASIQIMRILYPCIPFSSRLSGVLFMLCGFFLHSDAQYNLVSVGGIYRAGISSEIGARTYIQSSGIQVMALSHLWRQHAFGVQFSSLGVSNPQKPKYLASDPYVSHYFIDFEDDPGSPLDLGILYRLCPNNVFYASAGIGFGLWRERLFADRTYSEYNKGSSIEEVDPVYFDYDWLAKTFYFDLSGGAQLQLETIFLEFEAGYRYWYIKSPNINVASIHIGSTTKKYAYFDPKLTFGGYSNIYIAMRLGIRWYNGR